LTLGREGLKRVGENAVLSANYMRVKLAPYFEQKVDRHCMHECVMSATPQAQKGVHALDIAKAIPCGLIINELITNSFKHGFQQRENGTITVKMQYLNDGNIQFIIANDGKPFPDNVDFRDTQTLGLQIVTGLVEQIGGTIELDNSKGTKFTIVFSK